MFVDDGDFDLIRQYNWTCEDGKRTFYARRSVRKNGKRRVIQAHRQILGLLDSPTPIVDHIDGNGLNNQRDNLRICTSQQNAANARGKTKKGRTSTEKGVYLNRQKKWCAAICVQGKTLYLGIFTTEREAAMAYNAAAIKHFGEFACPNIIID